MCLPVVQGLQATEVTSILRDEPRCGYLCGDEEGGRVNGWRSGIQRYRAPFNQSRTNMRQMCRGRSVFTLLVACAVLMLVSALVFAKGGLPEIRKVVY